MLGEARAGGVVRFACKLAQLCNTYAEIKYVAHGLTYKTESPQNDYWRIVAALSPIFTKAAVDNEAHRMALDQREILNGLDRPIDEMKARLGIIGESSPAYAFLRAELDTLLEARQTVVDGRVFKDPALHREEIEKSLLDIISSC